MNTGSPGGTILRLGVVMRPHGLRGAFTVKPSSPGPAPSFLATILLQVSGAGAPVEVPVRTWKNATSGHWIVESPAFTLERAQAVRNALVLAPAAAFGPLADDEVWVEELLGAAVVWPDGVARGSVSGVLETPAPYPVLILADPTGREVYLPLPREHFISFDAAARVLVVSTPDP